MLLNILQLCIRSLRCLLIYIFIWRFHCFIISILIQIHRASTSGIVNFLCNFLICFNCFWQCSIGHLPAPLNNAEGDMLIVNSFPNQQGCYQSEVVFIVTMIQEEQLTSKIQEKGQRKQWSSNLNVGHVYHAWRCILLLTHAHHFLHYYTVFPRLACKDINICRNFRHKKCTLECRIFNCVLHQV